MKKYLLLATVAGFLLAHNAMATVVYSEDSPSATFNIYATFLGGYWVDVHEINFGTMMLTGAQENGDLLATFTNGTLSVEADKVSYHDGEEAGYAAFSSGPLVVTGLAFSDTTVALKDSSNHTVAEVYDLAMGGLVDPDAEIKSHWINAKLRYMMNELAATDGGVLTGTTTLTFQF